MAENLLYLFLSFEILSEQMEHLNKKSHKYKEKFSASFVIIFKYCIFKETIEPRAL